MKEFFFGLFGLLLWIGSAQATVLTEPSCFVFPKHLPAYTGVPKTVTYHSPAGEAELKATTLKPRLMNGSVMVVSTPEGEKTVMVLSDYLRGHSGHPYVLPRGWKFVRYVHRGEFELKDSFVVRGNETSGSAFEKGEHEANRVDNVMAYLQGCGLVSEATRFHPYDKRTEHYYRGFDESDGERAERDVRKLHKKRDALVNALPAVSGVLDLRLHDVLVNNDREVPTILQHWDILVQGLSDAELVKMATLKAGLEKCKAGTLSETEIPPLLEAFKMIEAKRNRAYVFEVK